MLFLELLLTTRTSSFDNAPFPPPFVCDSGLISSARESGVPSVTVDILQTGNEFACRSKQLVGPKPATMLEVGGCLAR